MFLCSREQFIAVGIVLFVTENSFFLFQQSRRKKRDISVFSALFCVVKVTSQFMSTNKTDKFRYCVFSRKLLWKLALVERTKE